MSGRPGSNRPPEAWKATALPNELLPLINVLISYFYNLLIMTPQNLKELKSAD